MVLIDLIYHTLKSCVWLDREISKEMIIDKSYLSDIDLTTAAHNVYTALYTAFSLAYTLEKVEPVIISFPKNEDNTYNLGDDAEQILNVYTINKNKKYKNLSFYGGMAKGEIIVEDNNADTIYFEYIRILPILSDINNDLELKDYGISNKLAILCSEYACAKLYDGYDQNVSYLKENNAVSEINALPTFGDKKLHIQEEIEDAYYA